MKIDDFKREDTALDAKQYRIVACFAEDFIVFMVNWWHSMLCYENQLIVLPLIRYLYRL